MWKTDNAIGIRDIHITEAWSRRPEGNTERLVEVLRKCADLRLSATLGEAQYANPTGSSFGNKHIAARRNPDQAWIVKISGEGFDDKPGRRFGPGFVRTLDDRRTVIGAGCRIWCRHVGWSYLTAHSRRIGAPILVSALSRKSGINHGRQHGEIMFAAEIDPEIEDGFITEITQPQLAADGRQMDLHFQPRETFADAIPRPH